MIPQKLSKILPVLMKISIISVFEKNLKMQFLKNEVLISQMLHAYLFSKEIKKNSVYSRSKF